jgi:Cd2+/Zn2+-exporting ATPase
MHAPARPTPADAGTTRCELAVKELDCASCAAHVEEALRDVAGVRAVQADVMRGRVRVDYDARTASTDAISAAIARIGYTPSPVATAAEGAASAPAPRDARLVATIVAAALLVPGLVLEWLDSAPTLAVALLAAATLAGGWFVVPRALKSARAGILDMHVLMSIAAVGAAIIGEWGEGASAMTLFGVAQWLEARAMSRARAAIAALLDVAPALATVVHDDHEHVVSADQVRVGALVLVRPGEKIPVDGTVEAGRGAVQQAAITGEPLPVDKAPGDAVYAGTINGDGVLRIRAERTAQDTTLARILHAVEEAQASRAPTQRFVDRFAQRYTPAVVVLAVLLAVVPPLAGGAEWRPWLERALAMLVVACPCALVISTPVTIVSALAAGARTGLLLKGGTALESLATVTTVAFDKTGTLTEGRAVVTEVVPLGDADEAAVWRAAVPVERASTHPVARAVATHGAARLAALGAGRAPDAHDAQALPGRGAEGTVDGVRVRVGSPRLLDDATVTPALRDTLARLEGDGNTAIVVEADARVLGVVAVSDRVRDEAPDALRALHAAGIREVPWGSASGWMPSRPTCSPRTRCGTCAIASRAASASRWSATGSTMHRPSRRRRWGSRWGRRGAPWRSRRPTPR